MPSGALAPPPRIVRDSARWFSEGTRLKREARLARRCVACGRGLDSRRTPYCSRLCQWRFQGGYFWDAARNYAMHRDRFVCQHCRRRYRVRALEVDHIVEIAAGGPPLDPANLQTLCRSCHRAKTVQFLRTRRRPEGAGPAVEASPEWFPA